MMLTTILGLLCLASTGCLFIVWMNTGWISDMLFYNLGGAGMGFLLSTLIINRQYVKKVHVKTKGLDE